MIRQQTIAKRLRDARPAEPADWADSVEGQAVLARVLDSPREGSSPSPSRSAAPGPRRRRLLAAAVVAAVAVAAVVLLGPSLVPGPGDSRPAHAPDLSILAGSGAADDYVVVDSPEELVARFNPDVIVVGVVEGIDQGPDIDTAGSPDLMHYIVVRVRVDQTLRTGKPGQVYDGHVYLPLYQGPTYENTGKPSVTLQEWRQAIPSGIRVMLFAGNWGPIGGDRVETDRGHPAGSHLLATPVQGMIFEYNHKIINWDVEEHRPSASGWKVQSIDDIVTRVQAYLKTHG